MRVQYVAPASDRIKPLEITITVAVYSTHNERFQLRG